MFAVLISGKSRNVEFFGVCDKEIRGVVPGAQLYTYAIGCGTCKPSVDFALKAIETTIQDGAKVISMSQAQAESNLIISPRNDANGFKLLLAADKVLACISSGNKGPLGGTAVHGMPWGITVDGCTGGDILVMDVEIAIAISENIPSGVHVLDRQQDMEGEFYIIDKIQVLYLGIS